MDYNIGFRILIVDDEIEYQRVFSYILSEKGYTVETCSNGIEALKKIESHDFDLIMTDLKMPGIDGIELIQRVKAKQKELEIMVMTAFGTIESAVEAMRYGATGYFVKSSDPETLLVEISRMAKIKALERTNEILKKNSTEPQLYLKTKSSTFKNILEICRKAAETDINVLLLGESGVGKEVIAKYIHQNSKRKERDFIPVNCQVFAQTMVESELFGHEKGAFTGATSKRIGRFEEANFGTLFLDEIGDLPASTQGKLLRTLETRTIERVGSNKSIDLDIRIIAATNKDLYKEISEGTFREDLLYRINTLEVVIPPLRNRREDIPGLIEYFLEKIQIEQKKKISYIDESTMDYLLNYDYPGNIRELKNILERLVALSENGEIRKRNQSNDVEIFEMSNFVGENEMVSLKMARSEFEKRYIERILECTSNNVTKAAKILEITTRQLWNKISEYKIER